MIPANLTYDQLIKDMISCKQTENMNVLEHGEMVNEYYFDLYDHLIDQNNILKYIWKIPTWMFYYKNKIIDNLCDKSIMKNYLIYHDLGKPYCHTIDKNGKQHFTNHSNVSYEVHKKLFPNDIIVSELIKMDMDIHKIKSTEIEEFSKHPLAISLIISGFCEIHANASMFGGITSDSFKIKYKQIDRRGKQILRTLFQEY